MSSFPPKQWQVRYLADLDTLAGTVHEDRPISLEALLAVRPSGGEEGSFRFTLAGPSHVKIRITVTDVLQDEAFKNMFLDIQMELGTQVKYSQGCINYLDKQDSTIHNTHYTIMFR